MGNQHKGSGSLHGNGGGSGGKGGGGYCVCPQCGYSIGHEAGTPCKTMFCPVCHVSLHRRETTGKGIGSADNKVQDAKPGTTSSKIQFPKVLTEKCTACGICIAVCPAGAIAMENGKALVNTELCSNCNVCIKACPVDAIILE
jgi:formate hydrogenlyase subunit 6/NADH:ubiquinone oxidoreductase subunit I